jgi:hypothetical protein
MNANDPVPLSADISNPGNRLLRSMGWEDGKGLGADGKGQQETIALAQRKSGAVAGIGASALPQVDYQNRKVSLYLNAQARMDLLEKQNK